MFFFNYSSSKWFSGKLDHLHSHSSPAVYSSSYIFNVCQFYRCTLVFHYFHLHFFFCEYWSLMLFWGVFIAICSSLTRPFVHTHCHFLNYIFNGFLLIWNNSLYIKNIDCLLAKCFSTCLLNIIYNNWVVRNISF